MKIITIALENYLYMLFFSSCESEKLAKSEQICIDDQLPF